ncbi:MAG TPA: hypothetical protein VF376_15355 [Thermoanaerobaculia bacterium]
MSLIKATCLPACALGLWSIVAAAAPREFVASSATPSAAQDQEITGEHRGYTNDHLFLRVSDDKEMTFVVRISGDTEEKWHEDFQPRSRITVTYHQGLDDKLPVATALRAASN